MIRSIKTGCAALAVIAISACSLVGGLADEYTLAPTGGAGGTVDAGGNGGDGGASGGAGGASGGAGGANPGGASANGGAGGAA